MTPRPSSAPGALSERVAEAKAANTGTALVPVTPTQLLEKNTQAIAAALPSMLTAERFTRAVLTEFRKPGNHLADCVRDNPHSVLGAVITLAQLGLEPGPLGLSYIEARRNHGTGKYEARPGIQYRGYVELGGRSGRLLTIGAYDVREGDDFRFDQATAELSHKWDLRTKRGPVYAHYGIARLRGGGTVPLVMSCFDCEEYRQFSELGKRDKGPWIDHREAMHRKTVILRMEPWLPKSTELALAFAADGRRVDQVEGQPVVNPEGDDFIDVEAEPDEEIIDGEIIGTPEGAADEARNAAAEQEAMDGWGEPRDYSDRDDAS